MQGERDGGIDVARLVAALGIVLFHSGAPGSSLGHAGLQVFLMLLVLTGLASARSVPLGRHLRRRALRLLRPWAIWSLIYGALMLADPDGGGLPPPGVLLLAGPQPHLWFLPFALGVSLLLWPLAQRLRPPWPGWTLLPGLGGAILLMALLRQAPPLPFPLTEWVQSVPALLIGLILAQGGGGIGALAMGLIALALPSGLGVAPLGLALTGLAVLRLRPVPASVWSARAAALALPIYLVHPLVAAALLRLTPLSPESWTLALATVLIATLVSTPVLWRGIPMRRAEAA